MDAKRDSREMRKIRLRNMALSVIVCLICGAVLILPMRNKVQQAYSFESAAAIDVASVRAEYAASGENDDLYLLALVLCRQEYIEGEDFDPAELRECGRELYRRAKAGDIDLEMIGDPTDTTAMINLLKDFGVTPMDS